MATTTKIIAFTTAGAGTWTVPPDFVSFTSIECIGAGGRAASGTNKGGSGGGAYAKSTSASTSVGSTVYYNVGASGLGISTANKQSWVNVSSNAVPTLTSQGAMAEGGGAASGAVAGAGGSTSTSVGDTKFAGGTGGTGGATSGTASGGGGGSAGPSGAGANGATPTSTGGGGGGGANGGTAGSNSGNTTGGAGGSPGGAAGGNSGSAFAGDATATTIATTTSGTVIAVSGGGGGSGILAGTSGPGGNATAGYGGGVGGGTNPTGNPGAGVIIITYVSTADRYWVGGTGTWNTSSTTNWAISSGGTAGASAPAFNDSVTIDANSGTGTITCTAGVCNNLTVTASQAITLGASSSTLSIYGNLSYPSGGSFVSFNGITFTFAATSTGKTITTNSRQLGLVTFNGVGGGWTLQDDLTVVATLTLTNGSFNANNFNVTGTSFSSSNSNTRTLAMGSGTWTLSSTFTIWNLATTTGLTFNANTSTIVLSNTSASSKTFAGGGLTYYNLSISAATGVATYIITGANTFNQISSSKTVTYTITLPASTTTTVTTWNPTGSSGNLLTLQSSLLLTAATLAVTNAFTVNYGLIQDVNLSATLIGTATNSTVITSNNWQIATTSTRWVGLVSGTQWASPSDWPSTAISNIHVIGGGGGGAGSTANASTKAAGGGGGGGGYTKAANTTLAASTLYNYTVGAAGTAGASGGTTSSTAGTGGTSSFTIPVTYVSSATSVQNTASATITVTVPSVSNGNLMIMIVQSSTVGQTWTTPAGWTASTASGGKAIFYRTASSEPASYTVTKSASTGTADAFIIAYANATFDTAGAFSANATPSQPPAITVAAANSTIIYYVGRDSAVSVTFTTPTGYTARQADSDATAPGAALFDLAGVAAGSYTAPTTTPSSGTASSVVIAIKPSTVYQATGGTGGASTTTTSTGGAGGVGSGGTTNYTGGTGGIGSTSTAANTGNGGGGGGGAAGPNGNGGNGGNGFSAATPNFSGGGGGGNGGGSAGGNASSSLSGAGGNNNAGAGGGAAVSGSGSGNAGSNGGGGSGGVASTGAGSNGGAGIDIISGLYGSGGGSGGAGGTTTAFAGGSFGGGGGGGGTGTAGGTALAGIAGGVGVIFIGYTGTYVPPVTSTGNYFLMFM